MENKKAPIEEGMVEIHLYEGRKLPEQYLNLVRSRWKRSYRHCNDFMKLVYAPAYYQAYSVYIENILNRPTCEVRLAVLADDNDVVLGFGVAERNVLHYVEVPTAYRKNGIGRNLIPEKVEWFTHLTKIGLKLWGRKFPDAKLNPFI